MYLKRLTLTNFRNHSNTSLEFSSPLIFFIGNNGEGKTNLLESISLLSYLKSFRESDENELLKWNTQNTFVRAEFEAGGDNYLFEYGIEQGSAKRKKIKINGKVLKKISESVGYFRAVILSPPDLKIIESGNIERRRFLDALISSTNRKYLNNLIEYNRILKQRNSVLKKEMISESEIEIWDEPLIIREEEIRIVRANFVKKLSTYFEKDLIQISYGKDRYSINYKPNVISKEEHRDKLKSNLRKDIAIGYTSCGNHRDDIPIGFDDKDISSFGSQGQKRSAVIALKTAAFKLIKEETGESPVLLIDDVIRELDVKRREYFVNLISDCGQAFFTTTDLEGIKEYIGSLPIEKQIFVVENGVARQLKSDEKN